MAAVNIGARLVNVAGKIGGKWGYINKVGEIVINPKFESALNFHEGLARVRMKGTKATKEGYTSGKWGYIDTTGNIVINLKFDIAGEFYGGLATAHIGDKWGYIDKTGKFVWKPSK